MDRQNELISSLELHPRIHAAVKKARLDAIKSVLVFSAGDLIRRTGLTPSDTESLIAAASTAVVSGSVSSTTALQLYRDKENSHNRGRLSTGCGSLDALLHGGLLVPGINEIAGVSGSGKTQLCLQLCLSAQLPSRTGGLDGGAVYICTEDAFPSKRWHQLASSFASKYSDLHFTVNKLSDSLYVEHAATISSLTKQLQYKLPYLLSQHLVKLVVIDSVAALFRVEYGSNQAIQRALVLRQLGHQLQRISNLYSVAVVCVNQVTAAIESNTPEANKPALGLTWADIVTMRLMLTRPEGVDSSENHLQAPRTIPRTLRVLLAPHLPQSTFQYYIDSDGIKAMSSLPHPI